MDWFARLLDAWAAPMVHTVDDKVIVVSPTGGYVHVVRREKRD